MANLLGGAAASLRGSEYWKLASELKPLHEESGFAPLQINSLPTLFPNGLARGTLAEIYGPRSSGRTALCLHVLAEATRRGEVCAVIDAYDNFHPASAQRCGVALERVVWVRCGGQAPAALRALDLLLHAGGFGVVLLDLSEAPPKVLNRIPISYWHRFRRAVEHTPAILLICAGSPQAKSCASFHLQTTMKAFSWSGMEPFALLQGLELYGTAGKASKGRGVPAPPEERGTAADWGAGRESVVRARFAKMAALRPQPVFLPAVP